ncbi:MAG: LysR family transcriptional regulator [Spirochaetes bacterium]|nr:LysR family transcriptional regulator [Spirochaetota bacterium]
MNTKQLRLFMLIADIKSFSKAAEHEALTQPAVTQQIIRLEREMGSVLFKRKNKRIELTKKGRLFYKFAKNMLSMMDSLERELRVIDSTDEGVLKIGSSHIPTSQMLYEKIAGFKKKYPNAYIIYELNDTENISYMVENEMLDIGFVGAIEDSNLDYKSFSGDELLLVASNSLDIPSKLNLSQLKEVPLIINQKESGVRKFLEKKLGECGISFSELNIISEIGLPESLLSVVRMGVGCAFVPSIIFDKVAAEGDLKVIEIKNFSAYRDYYMVTKKGVILSNLAQTFLDSFEFMT